MKRRCIKSRDNAELRAKIDKAKTILPMRTLMRALGYEEKNIGEQARCPFHDDHNPSFSVFQKNGAWWHKCFVGCTSGDEIAFLVKHFNISRREAIKHYLEMAGFPSRHTSESREYLNVSVSECRCVSVSPVSEGEVVHAELEKQIKALL